MDGQLTFLGTGTSMGVPTLGCDCAVCTSADPRDRRLRPSAALRWMEPPAASPTASLPASSAAASLPGTERVVVIDTGPDFRAQILRSGIERVDAVFYTHPHADHILGMDDLRPLSFKAMRESGEPIPLYAASETAAVLRRIFDYTFSPHTTYATRARVQIEPLGERNTVHGVEFLQIPVRHGELEIAGFRFGNTAYLTDVSAIPESSFLLLEGLDQLVLSALRHKPHPTHATVEQALAWARRIGARQTWLTHIAHDLGHAETNRALPANVQLAYDGQSLPVIL